MAFSVVIPTFEMQSHLEALWQSLCAAGVTQAAEEIVFVDDGSRDETASVLDAIAARPEAAGKLRVLRLPENVGRFEARRRGAAAARSENVLFLDTRLTLPEDFAKALLRAVATYPAIVGAVDIDTRKNRFCLYWDRSHKLIFRKHYAKAHAPIVLTPENFDDFLKGTGVFYCPRELFLRACEAFEGQDLLSDDTFLMRRMVEECPITVHPDVRVSWVPRETFREFVWRIWDRGPGFVEYHVFERRGLFFWVTTGALAASGAVLVLCVVAPPVGFSLAGAGLLAIGASTALLAKSPRELVALLPIHTAVTLAFGAGAVRGIWVSLKKRAGGQPAAGEAGRSTTSATSANA
ncbi:MAG: glycosyltransferase [Polyangiaceae bacterium]|nr:glycosyltransferase [Polyangiaceae bacterium]